MLVALQFTATVARQFPDDRFRDSLQEQDCRRHVTQVVNPQAHDSGSFASRLEGLSHVPEMLPLPGEPHISPFYGEDVWINAVAGEL